MQISTNYLGNTRNFLLKNNPYKFEVHIDRAIRFRFLIEKSNFVSCKIERARIPKGEKLTKEEKLAMSKMFVRF